MPVLVAAAIALPALGMATAARADDCAVIFKTFEDLSLVPAYSSAVSMTDGTTMRSVIIGDNVYVDTDGKWVKIPLKAGGRLGMLKSFLPDSGKLEGCSRLGADEIGGRPMTIFTYVLPVPKGMEAFAEEAGGPQKLWVGEDGLPYRMSAKTMEMEISYEGVAAPIP